MGLFLIEKQGSRIRIIRILFFEKYARILTYSIFSYVNKNKIRNYVFEMVTTSNYKHRNNEHQNQHQRVKIR